MEACPTEVVDAIVVGARLEGSHIFKSTVECSSCDLLDQFAFNPDTEANDIAVATVPSIEADADTCGGSFLGDILCIAGTTWVS